MIFNFLNRLLFFICYFEKIKNRSKNDKALKKKKDKIIFYFKMKYKE